MIEAGELATVGSGSDVNIERVLELDPSLVMTYATGNPAGDAHLQLRAAGVPVAINAEYMEPTPLGRAEWIKFTAAFFNQEAAAEEFFGAVAAQYEELATQTSAVAERPTLLANAPFQGTWYMPGGNSFPARLFADAGAAYLWADDDSSGSLQLGFETVLDRAADADIWVHPGAATTLDGLLAEDERFANFAAFQRGAVYNNNKRLNEHGGNDYWENGMTNPHLILADLIAILHPELLPNHTLYYYQQLR
jgi:iron complex transport system substrate-binding protein